MATEEAYLAEELAQEEDPDEEPENSIGGEWQPHVAAMDADQPAMEVAAIHDVEFTCTSCLIVLQRTLLVDTRSMTCRECA